MLEKDKPVYPVYRDRLDAWKHLKEDHFVPPNLSTGPFWSPKRFHNKLHRTEEQDHVHGEEVTVYTRKYTK